MPNLVSVEKESAIPTFGLAQNYPNPFNPSTNFEFRISSLEFTTLKIFDVLGREVSTLVDEMRPAGSYTVRWDGMDNRGVSVSSGIYLYQLVAGSSTVTKKMILLK
jgi:flagellar hook assembly protein FlgD